MNRRDFVGCLIAACCVKLQASPWTGDFLSILGRIERKNLPRLLGMQQVFNADLFFGEQPQTVCVYRITAECSENDSGLIEIVFMRNQNPYIGTHLAYNLTRFGEVLKLIDDANPA